MFVIISGPSGAGKNTIIAHLMDKYKNLKFLKSCTDRKKRGNGQDYIYLSKSQMQDNILNNKFFEYEHTHGNYYATLNKTVDDLCREDIVYIKDLGVLGHKFYRDSLKDRAKIFSIFLDADEKILRKRLLNRGEKNIDKRMERINFERNFKDDYDLVIDNIDINTTLEFMEKELKKHKFI